jgi:hypothetical protein
MPNFFHIIPVLNDTASDGVLEVQDTSFLIRLVTNVVSFIAETLHGLCVLGATNNGGEHVAWSFVSSETCLHHA